MALYTDAIQKLYVAYFSRPADFGGLNYWEGVVEAANGSTAAVSAAFAASAEYKANYGGLDSVHAVEAVYVNLFGRAAEPAGLAFWALALDNKILTIDKIVTAIASGAQGSDLDAYNAKVQVATAFTAALDTTTEILNYSGDNANAAAKAFISTITTSAQATAAVVPAALDASVAAVVLAGTPVPPVTNVNLTTALDTLVGGAGNDTFNGTIGAGAASTLTTLDNIDGKGGNNILNVSDLTGGTSLPGGLAVSSVQTVNVQSAGASVIDVTKGFTGLTTLNINVSTGADNITAGSQAVTVVDTAGKVTIAGGSTQTVTTAGGVALSGATGAITVTDTAQGTATTTIDDGTNVSLTASTTDGTAAGTINVGGGSAPSGTVAVVQNATITGTHTAPAVSVTGGTVDTITINEVQKTLDGAAVTTAGTVTVAGKSTTTSVSVTETTAQAAVAKATAVAAVTESSAVTFGVLKSGDSLSVGGLVFTANANMTAAQVAAAFANLTTGAVQGNATTGVYTGVVAGWTSGAASTATVPFTSTAAGPQTNLSVGVVLTNTSGLSAAPTYVEVDGVAAIKANAGTQGIANGAVLITDAKYGTGVNTIATVALDGFASGTQIKSDALTTLSLSNADSASASVYNNTAAALTLNLNGFTTGTLSLDAGAAKYTALAIKTATADSDMTLTSTATTAITVSGSNAVNLGTTAAHLTTLKTVTVSGAAGASIDATGSTTVTDFNASASSGANGATIDGTKATYEGGTGADTVVLTTVNSSKAISLGDGNDSITLASGTTLPTGAITGGNGTDTVNMVAADAVTASLSAVFASKVSGFEVLGLSGGAAAQLVHVDTLGAFNSVTTSGEADAGVLTMDGFTSGGTLTLNGSIAGTTGAYVVSSSAFTTPTTDVFNIVLSKSNAGITAGSVTAAKVETINIAANDTKSGVTAGSHTDTLNLVAADATTIKVTGNAHLTLTSANTAVTSIDASAMTGGITVTAAGTVAETIKGGAASNTLTASTGTLADVLIGGAAADTLTANAGLSTLTGGAGRDTFVIQTPSTNLNSYATITDASVGDTIKMAVLGADTFSQSKITLGGTAVFQDYANAAINAGGDAHVNGAIAWFQYNGDTYIVESLHNAVTTHDFQNGSDIVVKLTGLVDLSHTSLSTANGTLLIG